MNGREQKMATSGFATTHSPLQCEVVFPKPSQSPGEALSRWSNKNIELPAMIVRPNSEEDILDAIKARQAAESHTRTRKWRSRILCARHIKNTVPGHEEVQPRRPRQGRGDCAHRRRYVNRRSDQGAHQRRVLYPLAQLECCRLCWMSPRRGSGVMNGLHGFMIDVDRIDTAYHRGRG